MHHWEILSSEAQKQWSKRAYMYPDMNMKPNIGGSTRSLSTSEVNVRLALEHSESAQTMVMSPSVRRKKVVLAHLKLRATKTTMTRRSP